MVLGIDLGTSNTVASTVSRDNTATPIPDAFNKQMYATPSIVLIDDRRAYAGVFAENLFETFPDRQLLSFFKRNFGTQAPVFFDDFNNPWFSETVASLVLKKIKYDADMYLPDGFNQCVITVPAQYNDIQRKSVIDAARMADLELSAIIEEPVAAALFYCGGEKKIDDEIILVYDFGGGTFDLTLITKTGNQLNVIAKDGVNKLGGKEFDEIVKNTIHEHYQNTLKTPFPSDKVTHNRIQKIAEQIKIELNNKERSGILRKWIMINKEIIEICFDYDSYADKALELVVKTETAVNRCLRSLGMQWSDINKVVLIGGTSNSKIVYDFWQKKILPSQELIYHQPLSSVAKGAAIYASSLRNDNGSNRINAIDLKGVSTYNIGIVFQPENNKEIDLLIHRNTPLPVIAKKVYKVSKELQYVNIDLCQFWDPIDDLFKLGTLKAGPFILNDDLYLEVNIENRQNGTIGVKLKNADNGKDVRFEFLKQESKYTYNYLEQKTLVDNIYLNNYL